MPREMRICVGRAEMVVVEPMKWEEAVENGRRPTLLFEGERRLIQGRRNDFTSELVNNEFVGVEVVVGMEFHWSSQ